MAWGKNGTPDTLTGTGGVLAITDLTANKFNNILIHALLNGGSGSASGTQVGITSADSGANYCERSYENGTEYSGVNRGYYYHLYNGYPQQFTIHYAVNIAGQEKLFITDTVQAPSTGASSIPDRTESVGKWVTTSGQWDVFHSGSYGSGSFLEDTNMSALGSDMTPASTPVKIQDGTVFYETDTNKSYVLYNGSWTEL